jgi:hypothetical protein
MNAPFTSFALALLGALAAWVTLGVQAVVDEHTRARVGVLPSWWLLASFLIVFAGATAVRRLPPARLWPLALTTLVCLPWLPGAVPAAFLIWYGPMAAAVWGFVVVGLAAPEIGRLPQIDSLTNPRRAPAVVGVAALALFVAGAWMFRDRLPDGDEPHYLIITQSLLSDGDVRIENNHARGDYFPYHPDELRPDYLQRGRNGSIYSIHSPGVSVLIAPAFALAGWPGAAAFMSLLAAGAAMLGWRTAWRLTGDAGAAWVAAAAFAITAPGYFHAFTVFPDGAGAACVALAVSVLVALDSGHPVSRAALAGAGAALALLPWLHTRFAVLAGGLGAILLLRLWSRTDRRPAATALLAVPVVSAAAWFAYFWVIWGTPNPAAPYGQATQSAWSHLKPALPGLLFDQQFGLLANAPVYAAAGVGFVALARGHRRLAIELTALCAVYLVAVGTYRMWWGGHSAPARFLVAMLPALTPPLAFGWARGSAAGRAFTLVLLAISVALVVPRLVVDGGSLAYNERDGSDLLLDWMNRSVNLPLAWPSLHRDVVPDAWRDIGAWCVAAGTVGGAALFTSRRVGQSWTWMSAAAAVTIMVAASLVWRGGEESVTQDSSVLALIERWPSRPGGSGWQSSPFGVADAEQMPAHLLIASSKRRPRPGRPAPLWNATSVPGGQYELVVESNRPAGRLTLAVGESKQVLDEVSLDGRPAGGTGLVLTLPAGVASLAIHGDDRARASVTRLMLRPRAARNAAGAHSGEARRASRHGRVRVFFFDDNAFVEPTGFWTRGGSATDVFVDAVPPGTTAVPAAQTVLRLRAGPVVSSIEVSSGEWRQSVSLEPGEARLVPLPDRAVGWPLRLVTMTGFRPAQHDPGNQDLRNLGVWIEVVP